MTKLAIIGIAAALLSVLALVSGTAAAQTPTPLFTVDPSSAVTVMEDDGAEVTLTISREAGNNGAFLDVSTINGTAQAGSDFGAITSTVPLTEYDTRSELNLRTNRMATLTVPIEWDYEVEGDETFQIHLTIRNSHQGINNIRFPGNKTSFTLDVTITEREKYEVSLDPGTVLTEGETGRNNVRTERSGQGTVRARIGVTGSTAGGADFEKWAPFNLRINAYDPSAAIRTLSVATKEDTLVEASEDIILELSQPTGNLTFPDLDGDGEPDEAIYSTWVIRDNEPAIFAEIPDVTVTEGEEAQVTFTLERELLEGESVEFYTNVVGHQFGSQQPCGFGEDDYAQPNIDYMTAEYTEYLMQGLEQSLTFTVPTATDPLHEADECFYIRAFAASGLQFRTQTGQPVQGGNRILFAKVTIEDDDPKPHLIFGSPEVVEPDPNPYGVDPTATLRFPVSLSNPSGVEVTVDYREGSPVTPALDATSGVDYTAISPGTLTFMPGEVKRYVDVEVIADWLEEPDERVYLDFSNAVEACLLPGDDCQPSSGSVSVPGTILNDDRNLKITLTPDDDRVREGEAINFRARLSHPIDYEVRITSEWGGGTATEGDDYFRDLFSQSPELKIFPGTTEAVLTIATLDDNVPGEGVESLTLPNPKVLLYRKDGSFWTTIEVCHEIFGVRCDPSNVHHPIPTPTAYILDGPVINVTAEREVVAEGSSANFTVTLSEPVAQGVTFTITAIDGADGAAGAAVAEAGADYTRPYPQTVTIRPGDTDGGTYTVATIQDMVDEPNHAFQVMLTSVTGAPFDNGVAVVHIRDDDPRPTLSITDTQADEGDALTFNLTLSTASERTIVINYVTENDTASAGADYRGIERFESVTFAPGELSKTITVHSNMDNIPEIDETFRVELVDDPGVRITDATAVGTIMDDDGVVVSIADAEPVAETEGATPSATFTIALTPAQAAPVTVQWQTMDGLGAEHYAAKGGGLTISGEKDYTAVSAGSVTFAAGETVKQISTTVLDDNEPEVDEKFRAVISVSDPNITVLRSTAFATIEDDDAWNIWLDENNAAWVEEGTGEHKRITLKVQRTDASAEESPQDARYHTKYDYITCFISEVNEERHPFTRIPNPSQYASTATVIPTGWDVRRYHGDDTSTRYPRCHRRGSNSSFNIDTFGKLSYTLPLEFEIAGDSRPEENETFTLLLESSLFGPQGRRFDPVSRRFQYVTVTIVDDDTPQASITSVTVGEDVGNADVTVSLSMASSEQQMVRVSMEPGMAQPWEDYQPLFAYDVTFEPGETEKTVSIPIVNDGIREADEAFTVTLSNESDGINIHPGGKTATVTIRDDESDYLPRLTVPDLVVDEGDSATLIFRMNPPPPNRFWVGTIKWNDDEKPMSLPAATEGDDYAEITGNTADAVLVGFRPTEFSTASSVEFTTTVSSVEDTLIEGGEYIGITTQWNNSLGNPIELAKPDALVGIRDDDAGSVAIAPIAAGTVEENQEWTHTANLTGASNPLGDVSWSVADDDAAYFSIDQDTGVLTMSPRNYEDSLDHDEDNVYRVTVSAVDEDGNVDTEDVQVTVTDATYATFTVQVNFCCHADTSKQVYGAEEGDGIQVSVYPLFTSKTPVSLKWATAEDATGSNPAAATDYTPATSPTKLDWPAGDAGTTGTAQTFTIATTEDQLFEADETFLLSFTEGMAGDTDDVKFAFASAPDGSVRRDGNEADATLTIGNDDVMPPNTLMLSVSPASVGEGAGATTVTVKATLGGSSAFPESKTVTVEVGKDGDTAVSGTDYAAVNGLTIILPAGVTSGSAQFTLTPTQDALDEANEAITVHGTSSGLTVSDASLTITDDDTAATTASLSVSPASVGEGAGGTTVTVTATLGGTTTFTEDKTVTVTVGKNSDGAVSGTDYTAVDPVAVTISAGTLSGRKTFTLTPTQDTLDEPNEAITLSGAAPGLTVTDATLSITDDDATPSLTIGNASVSEGGKAEFTVTLSAVSGRDVTVQWTTGDDGTQGAKQATADTDYTAVTTARTATIAAGSTTATIEVQTTEDSLAEGDETFAVTLASPTNATLGSPSSGTGTITDDDTAATTASLSVSPASVGEGAGGTTVTVTATLGGTTTFAEDKTVTVTVGKNSDGAVSGTDYTAVDPIAVTISAGTLSGRKTFTLTPTQDTLDEANEAITLSGAATGLTVSDATLSITDDDATPSLTIGNASVSEGGKAEFTVTLSAVSGRDVTVQWTTGDDGTQGAKQATADTDYTAVTTARTATIAAGSTTATIEVQTTEDSLAEGDETFAVTLASPTNATLGSPSTGTGTITDDDTAATTASLSVSPASVGEGAGGTTVTVTATLGGTSTFAEDKTVTVTVGKNSDGAVSGTDYTAVDPVAVTISAGTLSGRKTFTLTPTQDTLDEANEAITLSGAATGLTVSDASLSITDDDATPSLTIGNASVSEGGKAEFTVTLSAVSGRDVTVQWTTGDDGTQGAKQATADTDYTAVTTARTATIAAGSTTATIEVQTTEDTVVEGDETFAVTLASPTNATLGSPSTGTGTITDDDTAATTASLSVSPASVGEGAGGTTVTVTATLGGTTTFAEDKTVTVTVGKNSDGAVSGTDYTAVDPIAVTISAGTLSGRKTFTLTPTQDTLDEANEAITLSGAATGLTVSDATLSITDDDATPSLTIGNASVSEGGKAEFTVTLSAVSGRDVTVQWTTGDDGTQGAKQATADTDYTAVTTARTATIAAGSTTATIEVQTTEDSLAEGDETFAVTLASPTNATLGSPSTGTGTITDDDTAATTASLSVSPASVGEGAGGTTVTVTATLGGTTTFAEDKTVTVTVGKNSDGAVSGTDYTAVDPIAVTISAGTLSGRKTFTLTPTQDTLDEANEAITLSGAATGLTVSDATLSITDDDATPSLTIGNASVSEGGKAEFTVTLSAVSGRDVTVQWTTGDDGTQGAKQATADTDYTAVTTARTATIAAGSTTATIEVQTTEDSLAEGDETFAVTLASPTNATLGSPSTGTGTITDDDTAATTASLSVSPASVGEGAGGTTVTVTATLGGTSTFAEDKTVTVTVGKNSDGAVSGTDYTAVDPVAVTISAGTLSGRKTFTLTPTQDTLDEPNEAITLSGAAPGLTVTDATLSITDDDATPSLTIGNASVSEGGKAEFTVRLSAVSGRDVTVQWTTGDDGTQGAKQATADTDYTAVTTARTATIAAGSTTATIEVQTTEDAVVEGDETFAVTLASPTNATLGSPSTGTGTITDDDTAATTASLSVSPASVGEGAGGTTVTVTATLGGTTTFTEDKTVTVTVGKNSDGAVSGTDYTAVDPVAVTISAGTLSGRKTFTLTPTQDTLDEPNEAITLSGAAPGLTVTDATLSITDDDATPSLTIGNASVSEGGKAEFTVTLSAVSGRDVTVQWTTGDDGTQGAKQATADTDYTAVTTARTATIAAGSTTATIEVQTTEDSLAEGDETFAVTLASPTNATLGSPSSGTGTITDDDTAATTASLSVSPASVGEGAGGTTVTVTATLGGTTTFAEDKTVTVTVGKNSDGAVSGTDYTAVDPVAVTISAGTLSGRKTFTLTPTQDTLDEANEAITLSGAAPGLTVTDATLSITDDDATPSLTIGNASVSEGGKAEFTVTLSAVSGRDVTVQWTTGDDGTQGAKQATADTDYTAVTTARTATIAAGSTTATIEVQTTEDSLAEGDETFAVTLASPTNATLGSPSTGTGTITDDDTAATTASLSVSPASVGEGAGGTTVTVTATLGGTSTFAEDKTVTVTVGKNSDGAVSGTDYTAVDPVAVTISAGTLSGRKTFTLTPTQDTLDEANEAITLSGAATGLTVSDASLSITDDDATPSLTIGNASVSEGGKAEFTVTLSAVSGRDVTVQWTTGDDGTQGAKQATADTDYTAVTTARTATIAAGSTTATIEVQTTEDTVVEGDETFAVTLASPTNATLGSPSTGTGTITDDDTAATTASLSVSPASVGEGAGGTTVTVTATLGGTSTFAEDKTVTVTVGKNSDGAVSGTDYTAVDPVAVTISAGTLSGRKTFTLTPTQDTLDEANEAITLSGAATGLTVSDASLSITDDDATPSLTIGNASVSEGGKAEFTVTLSAVSGRDVTVQWTTGDDGTQGAKQATADTDYTAVTTARTATIAAGSTTATIEVQTTEDSLAEGDETFAVTLASPTNATLGSPSTGTGTITDDDTAATTASLSVSPASVGEGAGGTTVTVTATLGGTSTFAEDKTVTVTVGKNSDAAVSGTDYTAVDPVAVTISAGTLSGRKTFTLTPTQDTLDEPNEAITLSGAAPGLTVTDATLSITDDDATPSLTIGNASVSEGGKAEFTVRLSAVSGRDVTVQWTTGDDGTQGAKQATADTDYTAVTTARTATIAAGSTTATIEVQTTEDAVVEGDETFAVTLASPTNATLGSPSTGTGTITDDDTAATTASLSVSPASVGEGAGGTTVTVTATLGGTSTFAEDKTVTVTVGKNSDGAVSGTDYTAVDPVAVTISAGTLSGRKTFTLTPTQDTLDEANEAITLSGAATGLTVSDASLSITDDDATPSLTIGNASVSEGGKAEFTVTLSAVSGRDVTVQWTTGDDGTQGAKQATADTDYTAVTTARTATIAAGSTTATIEVQTTEDSLAEGDETFAVTLASPTNATLGSPSTGTGTITDDDTAATTASLSVSPASVGEGAGGTTVTVTATLGGTSTFAEDKTVTVTVGKNSDAAVSGTDYTAVDPVAVTISAGTLSGRKTFTLTPTQDTLDEPNEAITLSGAAPGLTVTDATLSITDDDATPSLTIGNASVSEGGKAEFTVRLSAVSGRDVTVQWTTGDDGTQGAKQATADTDYTAVTTARTATIAAGSTTATIEVQTTEDAVVEGDETFAVTLASPTNATLGSPSTGTGTITDDDTAATTASLSVSPASVGEGAGGTTVTVTATLGGTSTFAEDKTVTVTVGKNSDGAVSGTDYTAVDPVAVTISAGTLSGRKTFTLTPTQDTLDEANEAITLSGAATGLTVSDASLSITDDDATPSLTIGNASVSEGGKAEFTVTLSAVSGRDVTVQWTTGDDGTQGAKQATADTDYTAVTTARTATIAAGSTTATIEVQTTEDSLAEGDETFAVTLASPTNATLGSPSTGTGTITDDDTAATTASLSVSPASVGEGAGGTTVTVTATLGGTSTFAEDKTVTVTVGKNSDAAVSGTDYAAVANFDITIDAGWSGGQTTFTFTPTQDALDEGNETLTLSGAATGLTLSDATLAITDDDSDRNPLDGRTVISINYPKTHEKDTTTADLVFTVTLDLSSSQEITVDYADAATGTATSGTDYTAITAGTLTFAPGEKSKTVTVTVTGDADVEGDETVVLRLSSPTNATLSGDGSTLDGTGTIWENDGAYANRPRVSIISDYAGLQGGMLWFAIRFSKSLSEEVHIPIDVEYITADDDEKCGHGGVIDEYCTSDTLEEIVPHWTLLSPYSENGDPSPREMYANEPVGSSYIINPARPYYQTMPAGLTYIPNNFYIRQDGDGDNERFRIVFDTDHPHWPADLPPAEYSGYAEGLVMDKVNFPMAGCWWEQLSADERERMLIGGFPVTGIRDGTLAEAIMSSYGRHIMEGLEIPFKCRAGALAGELVNAEGEDELRDAGLRVLDLTSVDTWWDSMDCRLRRVAVGDGVTDDPTNPWCQGTFAELGQAEKDRVEAIFEALTSIDCVIHQTPEISITAGASITEGENAVFTVTADPAPSADLDVTVTVSQTGDFGVTPGSHTVTIPTSGSVTLTVATSDDNVDEADGFAAATVSEGEGYTVSDAAGSATVVVTDDDGAPTKVCTPNLPSDAITVAEVKGWRDEFSHSEHVSRWNRVLAALGEDSGETAMTAAQAEAIKQQFDNSRWDRTLRTLEALEDCSDPPDTTPEVSITADASITEGENSVFTVTASPTPHAPLAVTIALSQSGDFGVSPGSQTVTIPTSGSATLTVATVNDSVDEADGSVTATVNSGTGYTVSTTAGSATIAVEDDDDTSPPPPTTPEVSITAGDDITEGGNAVFTVTANPAPNAALAVTIALSQSGDFGVSPGSQTVTIPTSGSATLTVATVNDSVDEADGSVTATVNSGTGYTVSTTAGSATIAVEDDDDTSPPPPTTPEVSITAGDDITEGGNAVFTVTANPAPNAALSVTIAVSQIGDFGVTTGSRTVTIPTSGSATLTVATVNDSVDEADGSVTATVNSGTGYTVSTTAGSATIAVEDDDDTSPPATPCVSISAGDDITEGGNAVFTVTANPAPNAALSVTIAVSQIGDFGVTTGSRTVTIPTSGSATLTIATTNDNVDETHGSITATLHNGQGYTTKLGAGWARVSVSDDDESPRSNITISIADASGPESNDIEFTVTLSEAAPHEIRVWWESVIDYSRNHAAVCNSDFFCMDGWLVFAPGETSQTGVVWLHNDTRQESNKEFLVQLSKPEGAVIADGEAVMTIIDDD